MATIVSRDSVATLAETSDMANSAQQPNFFVNEFVTFGLEPGPFFDLLLEVIDDKQLVESVFRDREKILVGLTAMGFLPAGQRREKRLREVLQSWRGFEIPAWFGASDPAGDVRVVLSRTAHLSAAELDAIVYEALRKAPAPLDSRFLVEVHTNLVCLLALRDVDLAKSLLEPMFLDGSWHLGITYDQSVFRNQTLLAAGWVDPVWAAQLARKLAADYCGNDESRRLEIYCTILEGMAQKRQLRGHR